MAMLNCVVWRLKDDAYPELLPESRKEINAAAEAMCEENAALGYQQGIKRGFVGGMLVTGLVGCVIGCGVAAYLQTKNENKKFNK